MAQQSAKIPGEILQKTFLDEYGLAPAKVAEDTGISPSTIRLVLMGKIRISLKVAIRLAKYFGNTHQYWLDLQIKHDLAELQKDAAFLDALKQIPKAKKQVPGRKAKPQKAAARKAGTKTAPTRKPRAAKKAES
jgi:addiction module HigA family antidote